MEGLTGEIDIQTEMGAPTPMGQGVGELMVTESVEEVLPQMNAGGPVQYFANGNEVGPLSGTATRIGASQKEFRPFYEEILGYSDADRDLAKLSMYTDLANRGLAIASGTDPRTGQEMSGSVVGQAAQAFQGFPQTMMQGAVAERASQRAVDKAALDQAMSQETAYTAFDRAKQLETHKAGVANEATQLVEIVDTTQGNKQVKVLDARSATYPTDLAPYLDDETGELKSQFAIYDVRPQPTSQYETKQETLRADTGRGMLDKAYSDADTARNQRNSLSLIRPLVESGGFQTGEFADTRQFFGKLANLFGRSTDSIPAIGNPGFGTAIEGLSNQLALTTLSDLDNIRASTLPLRMIQSAGPQLGATPEGNLLLIDLRGKLNDRSLDIEKIALTFEDLGAFSLAPSGEYEGLNFRQAVDKYDTENPLLTETFFDERPEFRNLIDITTPEQSRANYQQWMDRAAQTGFDVNLLEPWEQLNYHMTMRAQEARSSDAAAMDAASSVYRPQ